MNRIEGRVRSVEEGCLMRLFYAFNRVVARLCGSIGWCAMGYLFNRTYRGQNPLSAWWNAFLFKRRNER